MQSLNDDMDELFKQAAERYPLKTDSENWDSVLNKMDQSSRPAQVKTSSPNKRKLLWLLLLIPFAWVCNNYFMGDDDAIISSSSKQIISKPSGDKEIEKPVKTTGKISTYKLHSGINLSKEKASEPDFNKSVINFNDGFPNKEIRVTHNDQKTASLKAGYSINIIVSDKEFLLQTPGLFPVIHTISVNPFPLQKRVLILDSTLNKPLSKSKDEISKPKKFYAGMLAGPDISTIKFQKISRTGFNLGVVIGYHLNKRFSLQTGLVYNKKTYYTKGSYFNTTHLYLPPDYKIKTVDGNCQMYEVPLIVHYRLSSKKRNSLLLNAGISSYLMKGEKYDYFVEHNGYEYTKAASYDKRSVKAMAAAIGGVGLQNSIGKGITLNINPYFKIPLGGVGVGKLPITSGGINISLTKDLF